MKDRTKREIEEIVRNGTSITEMIIADHNALDPIYLTEEMKERGIENFDAIIKSNLARKWASKLNRFFVKYPEYRNDLENHENFKNLLIRYPEIKNQLN
jgi:hypothetical protein